MGKNTINIHILSQHGRKQLQADEGKGEIEKKESVFVLFVKQLADEFDCVTILSESTQFRAYTTFDYLHCCSFNVIHFSLNLP